MEKKMITLKEFAGELRERLEDGKTVDCCKEELLNLASLLEKNHPNEMIEVNWHESRTV